MDRKADYAYQIIKAKIINGEYAPMTDLSEEDLQKALGFSRTPVREAILRLRDDGFIIVFPKKGTIVSPVSRELIEEIYEIRFLNEPFCCQKASRIMPAEILKSIREKLLHPEIDDSNPVARRMYLISLDDQLHYKILQYCGNSFLIKTMSLAYAHNDRFRRFSSNPARDNSIQEHIAIIDAMLKQDPEAILASAIAHLEASMQFTIETFASFKAMNNALSNDFLTSSLYPAQ